MFRKMEDDLENAETKVDEDPIPQKKRKLIRYGKNKFNTEKFKKNKTS